MRKHVKNAVLAAACLSTAFAVPPSAIAGPMTVAPPDKVGLSAPVSNVHYRRHRAYYPRYYGYYPRRHYGYYPRYYRRYGYDPAGAMFATAALGIMGAGLAAATAPRWGYWGYGGWGGGPWGYRPWGYGGWGPGWGWGGWW